MPESHNKTKVGILGATGVVGQTFVKLLHDHPWFEITSLTASDNSAGKTYKDACAWHVSELCPESIANMVVKRTAPDIDCRIVFSALGGENITDIEESFAREGYVVVSNASGFRMDEDVPLLVPEINPGHTIRIEKQKLRWGNSGGYIVTNPNCCSVPLSMALHPVYAEWGIESVLVTTLQAVSGAGYPGVASMDILGNIIPFIKSEEEKIAIETKKILGGCNDQGFAFADMQVSAQVNRVPVLNGHLLSVSFKLKNAATVEELKKAISTFQSVPQKQKLPTAPKNPLVVKDEPERPQPRYDVDAENGMTVTVGNIRECEVLDFKCTVLGHNLIRGAAGGAVLNAELLKEEGLL